MNKSTCSMKHYQWMIVENTIEVLGVAHILSIILLFVGLAELDTTISLLGGYLITWGFFKIMFKANPLHVVAENAYFKMIDLDGRSRYEHIDTLLAVMMTLFIFCISASSISKLLA